MVCLEVPEFFIIASSFSKVLTLHKLQWCLPLDNKVINSLEKISINHALLFDSVYYYILSSEVGHLWSFLLNL